MLGNAAAPFAGCLRQERQRLASLDFLLSIEMREVVCSLQDSETFAVVSGYDLQKISTRMWMS